MVQRLLKLMEFRNSYPAFNGEFKLFKSSDMELNLEWTFKKHVATAYINVKSYETKITYTDPVASRVVDFEV